MSVLAICIVSVKGDIGAIVKQSILPYDFRRHWYLVVFVCLILLFVLSFENIYNIISKFNSTITSIKSSYKNQSLYNARYVSSR